MCAFLRGQANSLTLGTVPIARVVWVGTGRAAITSVPSDYKTASIRPWIGKKKVAVCIILFVVRVGMNALYSSSDDLFACMSETAFAALFMRGS